MEKEGIVEVVGYVFYLLILVTGLILFGWSIGEGNITLGQINHTSLSIIGFTLLPICTVVSIFFTFYFGFPEKIDRWSIKNEK